MAFTCISRRTSLVKGHITLVQLLHNVFFSTSRSVVPSRMKEGRDAAKSPEQQRENWIAHCWRQLPKTIAPTSSEPSSALFQHFAALFYLTSDSPAIELFKFTFPVLPLVTATAVPCSSTYPRTIRRFSILPLPICSDDFLFAFSTLVLSISKLRTSKRLTVIATGFTTIPTNVACNQSTFEYSCRNVFERKLF